MSDFKTKRLHSNLLQQNVYVRDCSLGSDIEGNKSGSTFVTLNENITDKGLEQSFEEVPYPITPESVASYASSCDYKVDPVAAFNAPSRGVNLGDVSALQEVGSMDSETARALYEQLSAKFAEKSVEKSVEKPAEKSAESEVK